MEKETTQSEEKKDDNVIDTKTNVAQPSEHTINIKVVNQDGAEVYFKIKTTTPFKRLMDAYCNRQGQIVTSFRFLYDGQRLMAQDTPASIDMENDDIIDVVLQQTGGNKRR